MANDERRSVRPRRPTRLSTAIGLGGVFSLIAGGSFALGWTFTDSGGRTGTASSGSGPREALVAGIVLASVGVTLVVLGTRMSPRAVTDDWPEAYYPRSLLGVFLGIGISVVAPLVVTSMLADSSSQPWLPLVFAIPMLVALLVALSAPRKPKF